MKKNTRVKFQLSSLVVFSHIALFAGTPADSLRPKEIQEITVVGEIPRNLSFPSVVVGGESLQASSFFTPADALQR
ncbi:MAG TPA: hypothetical protein VK152_02800, partial [Paludibacter sp.]|nr:hypothetical protein [Paludibacter sp.]